MAARWEKNIGHSWSGFMVRVGVPMGTTTKASHGTPIGRRSLVVKRQPREAS